MTEKEAKSEAYQKIAVIGGGAWGTALACVAAQNGHAVMLWAREPEVVESINSTHENALFLPDIPLPTNISAHAQLGVAAEADAILAVVPAQHMRASLSQLATHIKLGTPVVLCAKGIE